MSSDVSKDQVVPDARISDDADEAAASAPTILSVRDMWVEYKTPQGYLQAVRGANLDIKRGESVALIGESGSVLYRRSLTGGTTDAFLARTYRQVMDADLGCAQGWRFGSTILPGEIRVEDVYNAMKPTPSPIYRVQLRGRTIRTLLEDNLDNVFNPDPLQRLGGDMNRCDGMKGDLRTGAPRGQRTTNLALNGLALDDDAVYRIANSGGRVYTLDPEAEITDRPAVDILIETIETQSEPIQAEPVEVFTFLD